MIATRAVAVFLCCTMISHPARAETAENINLYDMAASYCVDADGDHQLTWNRAIDDGFTELSPDNFRDLRLPGARQLRGYTKTIDGVSVRILTAHNRISGGGVGTAYFNLCWVSGDPLERGPVDRDVRSQTSIRGFREDGARVYAWVPMPDGSQRIVSSREFRERAQAITREEGMRMLLTNDYLGMVAITYMSPAQTCADWCY